MPLIEPADPGEHWSASAVCAQVDPALFTPDRGNGRRETREMCRRCPVRVECLDEALANDEQFGIWGGLNLRERRALKRRGGRKGAAA
jgi:WhiB family redox-sensing transcriptional regulator